MKIVLAFFLSCFALSAMAQEPQLQTRQGPTACAKRELVIEKLIKRFGETLRTVGLQRTGNVVESYASDKTGTWTILITRPDGMSCLLAAGEFWVDASEPPGDPL